MVRELESIRPVAGNADRILLTDLRWITRDAIEALFERKRRRIEGGAVESACKIVFVLSGSIFNQNKTLKNLGRNVIEDTKFQRTLVNDLKEKVDLIRRRIDLLSPEELFEIVRFSRSSDLQSILTLINTDPSRS